MLTMEHRQRDTRESLSDVVLRSSTPSPHSPRWCNVEKCLFSSSRSEQLLGLCVVEECVSHCFQVTQPLCSAAETRAKVQISLQTLHPRHKKLQEPDSYTVSVIRAELASFSKVSLTDPYSPVLSFSPRQVALSERLHNLVTEIHQGSSSDSSFLLAN